jgi:hypothetical protein
MGSFSSRSTASYTWWSFRLRTAAPSISGASTEGQVLAESRGSWANDQTSYSYQWEDCDSSGNNCSAIIGATSQGYTLTFQELDSVGEIFGLHPLAVEDSRVSGQRPKLDRY